jgi:hypothetical protein
MLEVTVQCHKLWWPAIAWKPAAIGSHRAVYAKHTLGEEAWVSRALFGTLRSLIGEQDGNKRLAMPEEVAGVMRSRSSFEF